MLRLLLTVGVAALLPLAGAAEEGQVNIQGTTNQLELAWVEIEQELELAAEPQRVYDAFVDEIGVWWSRDYTMGGPRTVDMLLEATPGGRLLEVYENGGGNVWAVVTGLNPGRSIRLGVYDGMLWSGPGIITVSFELQGQGTLLKLWHGCSQLYSEDGHSGYAQGWTTLLGERFKQYVETGSVPEPVRRDG